jgi:hypothetical protein
VLVPSPEEETSGVLVSERCPLGLPQTGSEPLPSFLHQEDDG